MKPHLRSPLPQRLSGSPPGSLAELVDTLQAHGRYTFQRQDAVATLGVSEIAFQKAAHRLMGKRRIVAPRRGFFVVVPPEYAVAGAPPPSWFIADLMTFLGQPYYVGLLSAAGLHGASHQQPQEFQAMTDRPSRPAAAGRTRVRFFHKRHLQPASTIEMTTYTGTMLVSTPEATAFDLVRYVENVGHIDNVATVLSELAEVIDPLRLVDVAQAHVELTVVQRLGFLLDFVGAHDIVGPLAQWVAKQRPRSTPLRPNRPMEGSAKDSLWRVVVNDTIDLDI